MKRYYLLLFVSILVSCKSNPAKTRVGVKPRSVHVLPASYKTGSSLKKAAADTAGDNEQLDAYTNYYIIVADTGSNYEALKNKMLALHNTANIEIDTMGRSYNKAKDLIALADDDKDEMFAGDYYPRRSVSSTLSLEYLSMYIDNVSPKTIAVIAGIYETKESADSAWKAIGNVDTHIVKAHMYIGCIH